MISGIFLCSPSHPFLQSVGQGLDSQSVEGEMYMISSLCNPHICICTSISLYIEEIIIKSQTFLSSALSPRVKKALVGPNWEAEAASGASWLFVFLACGSKQMVEHLWLGT